MPSMELGMGQGAWISAPLYNFQEGKELPETSSRREVQQSLPLRSEICTAPEPSKDLPVQEPLSTSRGQEMNAHTGPLSPSVEPTHLLFQCRDSAEDVFNDFHFVCRDEWWSI